MNEKKPKLNLGNLDDILNRGKEKSKTDVEESSQKKTGLGGMIDSLDLIQKKKNTKENDLKKTLNNSEDLENIKAEKKV
ncbi:MAG: hypothetical protein LIO71_03640 [Ruminococcus sp.]|nr:hypothetical protein [Ruminococcus sp.]